MRSFNLFREERLLYTHVVGMYCFSIVFPYVYFLGDKSNLEAWKLFGSSLPLYLLAFVIVFIAFPLAYITLISFLKKKNKYVSVCISLIFFLCLSYVLCDFFLDSLFSIHEYSNRFLSAFLAIILLVIVLRLAVVREVLLLFMMLGIFSVGYHVFSAAKTFPILNKTTERPVNNNVNTPLVLIVLDEFPVYILFNENLEIDGERFPFLRQFANKSTWYRNTTAVYDQTTIAVPAILTGQKTTSLDNLPIADNYPKNLFNVMPSHYMINAFETNTWLCAGRQCNNFDLFQDVKLKILLKNIFYLGRMLLLEQKKLDDILSHNAINFINKKTDNNLTGQNIKNIEKGDISSIKQFFKADGKGRPGFYFVHFLLPHEPYERLPNGDKHSCFVNDYSLVDKNKKNPEEWEWYTHVKNQLLSMQTVFTDNKLNEIISTLKNNKIYDDSIIVVISDHGISHQSGEYKRTVTENNLADIAQVPLFIKYPNQKTGEIIDFPATTLDVYPTILAAIGLDIPKNIDGQNLKKLSAMDRKRLVFSSDHQRVPIEYDFEDWANNSVEFLNKYKKEKYFLETNLFIKNKRNIVKSDISYEITRNNSLCVGLDIFGDVESGDGVFMETSDGQFFSGKIVKSTTGELQTLFLSDFGKIGIEADSTKFYLQKQSEKNQNTYQLIPR